MLKKINKSVLSISEIASMRLPVLCFDTCTALDLIRDLTRGNINPCERKSAVELLSLLESGSFILLMADQVFIEYNANVELVINEAKTSLEKLCKLIKKIDEVASVYGSHGKSNTDHLDDYISKSRIYADKWIEYATRFAEPKNIASKAHLRVNSAKAPARKGKDSFKDCVIIETYLDIVKQLRELGVDTKIVFVSSNTDDFAEKNKAQIKKDLSLEFSDLNIDFAPNLGSAKYQLNL